MDATRLAPAPRPLRTAHLLAIGSELTSGETRDTNGGDLAGALSMQGVAVRRIAALPDDLGVVTLAFAAALADADLVLSTGGLGPTPDDLTREAVAAAIGEVPEVDPDLEAWLRALFERRGIALPEVNLKQAWLIPSATTIPNPNGTAPGWWVDRPDGRVLVLLPGPPRELRPMWTGWVLPHLVERGLGDGRVVRTLRTYGIGESHVAELLGESMLRAANPVVATYARADWLDVRISAVDEAGIDGCVAKPAAAILDATAATVREILEGFVRAEGETTWADLVAEAAALGNVRLAIVEAGTHGTLGTLLAEVPALDRSVTHGPGVAPEPTDWPLDEIAAEVARDAGADIGVALVARATDAETRLRVVVAEPALDRTSALDLRLFQHGAHGRFRAAVAAAAFLVEVLRGRASTGD
jgi:nicotinamide-nucleotide amidase